MLFTALKIPTAEGHVTLAGASAGIDGLQELDCLPAGWMGIPADETDTRNGILRYLPQPESGFHALQIFENKRYFLEIPTGAGLKTSFATEERIPNNPNGYFFNINSYLGTTSLTVGTSNPLLFDVVSTKLEYHNEYRAIVEAIASQCNQLLLEWSAPTALRFEADPEKQSQILLEQFLFLRHVLSSDKLDLYLETIRRNPHNSLEFEDEWKPAGAAIPAPQYFEEPMRFGRDWSYPASGAAQPAQVMTRRKFETLDTPANRFIKFALERFQALCDRVIFHFQKDCGTAWMEAKDMRDALDAFLSAPFFREVGRLSFMPGNNQTLLKREGYREILHAWLMLDAATQLDWPGRGDAYDGTTRDVPTLYEYWLYFVMRKIMRGMDNCSEVEITTGDAKNTKPFIERSRDALCLNLKQGQASLSAFSWKHPETGAELRVHFYFNRTFAPHSATQEDPDQVLRTGSYSRPFRPDYSLVIFPEQYAGDKRTVRSLLQAERQAEADGAIAFLHFDAKYRVDKLEGIFGKAVQTKSRGDAIEEELDSENEKELDEEHHESAARNTYKRGDLLKMHTYNEAIRRTAGSYVLYPGKRQDTETFERFHEILPGVGAFVARPISDGDNDRIAMEGESELCEFITNVLTIQQDKFSQIYRINYWTHDTVKEPPRKYLTHKPSQPKTPPDDIKVLLGFMRKEKLAKACRLAGYFYFHAVEKDGSSAKSIDLTKLKSEYIFPYGPKGRSWGWIGRITSVALLDRDELVKKLGIADRELKSECLHYFAVGFEVANENPPVDDVSHLIPPRNRAPQMVKWSDLCRKPPDNRD